MSVCRWSCKIELRPDFAFCFAGLYGYIDLTDASNFVSSPSVLPVSDTRTFCFMALDKGESPHPNPLPNLQLNKNKITGTPDLKDPGWFLTNTFECQW